MTNEEIRIAIATACPQVFASPIGAASWNYKSSVAGRVLPCIDGDPLKDLNAMAEAEKVLSNPQRVKYRMRLADNSGKPNTKYRTVEDAMCHATAAERAEAFLRTLGKWRNQ